MPTDESGWDVDRARSRDTSGSPDDGPLAVQFTRLTRNLLDAASVADVLEQVVHAAQRVVAGVDLVSVTLRSADGGLHTPVETEPLASELDRLQYEAQEGPCFTAAQPSGPGQVRSDDLAHESAWPRFGPAAAELGVCAVFSVSLVPDARPPRYTGALNLYSRHPGTLSATAHEPVLLLATHASLALARSVAVTRADLTVEQLHKAIGSRDVIGQAKGILMARGGITADEAFDHLRRTSQDLNVKLADVARLVAARHSELGRSSTVAPPHGD